MGEAPRGQTGMMGKTNNKTRKRRTSRHSVMSWGLKEKNNQIKKVHLLGRTWSYIGTLGSVL
jgi:hypothetical protein